MRAALGLLALVACGPPEIEGAVTFTSQHLVVHADPQYALCDDSLARADAFLEAVAGFLDVPVPQVEYNLYGGLHSACGLGFPGDCTLDGEIWSASWIHDHEMVHAVAAPWGRPPAFLVEGLAEGLGSHYPLLSPDERRSIDLAAELDSVVFFSGSLEEIDRAYRASGDFFVYLVRRFGLARVGRLYRGLLYFSDRITIERAIRAELGVPLDEILEGWRAGDPLPEEPVLPRDAVRCAAPPLPVAGGAFAIDEDLACASGYTATGGQLRQPLVHTALLPEAGLHLMTLRGDDVELLVARVDACRLEQPQLFGSVQRGGERLVVGPLSAGLHSVSIARDGRLGRDPGPARVRLDLAPFPDAAAACADAPVVAPGRTGFDLSFSLPSSGWVGLTLPAGVTRIGYGWNQSRPARVHLCAGCGGACVTLEAGARGAIWEPPPGAPIRIQVEAEPGAAPVAFFVVRVP